MPVQPIDCREALHWFVETVGLYKGSTRGLLVSNFDESFEPYVESAVINLKSRGITPAVVEGAAIYQQANRLWDQAVRSTSFGRPVATQFELDLTGSPVTVINNFTAPETAQQLWYLYHHILYPRALSGKPVLITTKHDYYELVGLGSQCEDLEYAGRKVTWEKVLYILEATAIDLHHFSQLKEEELPPMLKAEYYLYKTLKARDFPITPMHVVGDYMLDFAIYNRHAKLDVEIDNVSSLQGSGSYSAEAKKNLELLSDGWKIVRLTNSEILSNVVACADAVEDVWRGGLKKSSYGRLISGNDNIVVPELPVEEEVQRMAISHGAGPAAITGGAGCGKTTVLAHRIVNLLNQGINPESILVISYSKETLAPLKTMMDEIGDKLLLQKVNFFTWHDLGLKILKENLSAIKRKPPLKVEQNVLKVIQRLLQKYKKDLDPTTLELSEEVDEFMLVSLISLYKANLVAPKHVKERGKGDIDELVAKVYQAYEDQLQKANRVDRDDMITLSANLLVENAEVRARYQYQFEYVLIDEYQDASAAMDLLARLLSFPQDNLFILGDEDTTIWESKGSLPRLLPEVSLRLPNARCYTLDKNWRCHPAIVENSRQIVRALERRRMQKDFHSGWGPAPTEAVVGPQILPDEMAESEWVADEMQILIDSGRQSGEMVVLYRQNNYAILIEEALTRRNIRCIATHPDAGMIPDEVGDVMAFLRLVMDPDGPKARESFERICQLRVKEVDPKLSATIASFGEANNLSYLKAVEIYSEAVSDPSCIDLAQLVRIIRTMHAEKLPPAETISLLKRTQRLNEFYKSIKVPAGVNYEPLRKLAQLEEEARQYKSVSEFVKAFSARQQDKGEGNEGPVRILNVNETKGLEYPIVFLVGMSDGLFPSDVADLEEERRLFYLAVSRARELLYISSPSAFNGESLLPSFFLAEGGFQLAAPAKPPGQAAASQQPVPTPAPTPTPAPQVVAPPAPPPVKPDPAPVKSQSTPVKAEPIPVKPDPGVKPVAKPLPAQASGVSAAIPVKPDPGSQPVVKPAAPPPAASNIPVLPDPGIQQKAAAQAPQQPVAAPAPAPVPAPPPPPPQAPSQPHIIPVKPAAPVAPSLTQPQIPIRPAAPAAEQIPVKPATPQPMPQPLPQMQPAAPQIIPVRPQAPPSVAAHAEAIPVKPDPGFADDDMPVIIKPVTKPISESVSIRPDPIIEELLAPLPQQPVTKEVVAKDAGASLAPPAMPHVMPQMQPPAPLQTPPHAFSQAPLEAPDPLFQATQQSLVQPSAPPQEPPPALSAAEGEVKYNVFGIPIGPDEEPIVEAKPEVVKAETNQAIVSQAAKSAARTHPGLPAGFIIPDADPAQFSLPSVSNSLFKARAKTDGLASFEPAKTPDLSQLVINSGELAAAFAPTSDPVQPVTPVPLESPLVTPDPVLAAEPVASAPEAPAAPPAKGKRGRKAKNAEAAAAEPAAKAETPVEISAPPAAEVPLQPVLAAPDEAPAQPFEEFPAQPPVPIPAQSNTGSIIAAAAAAAFGQLPDEAQKPVQPAAPQGAIEEVDEEGFIIQTFVEPAAFVDPERTLALPQQNMSLPQPPAALSPPPPPPWHTGGEIGSEGAANTPFTQLQQLQPAQQPSVQQPPVQSPVQQGQPSLLQQWSAKAKDHAGETPEPVHAPAPIDIPAPANAAASVAASADPTAAPVAQEDEAAPAAAAQAPDEEPAPPPPPSPFHSHDHIVGDKYQTGAGEHHRGSWMEQGPTPNVSVPLPADYNPDKPQDIGAPVRKGPQRPQISPLYQESFQSPVEKPVVPVQPPAPPAVPLADVDDIIAEAEAESAATEEASAKKGKRPWSEVKGGLSKGQRPEDAPVVYTNKQREQEAETAFPEVAAHPMLPNAPLHSQPALPQPAAMSPQPQQAPPPASFARGDDEAPHCPQCSARLEGGSQFCGECGHKLGVRIPQCVSCQSPLDPAARFCGECGTKVTDVAANGQNPAPQHGAPAGAPQQPADPEKAMEDYLSGFGPNQKDKHWSNKLKKILD